MNHRRLRFPSRPLTLVAFVAMACALWGCPSGQLITATPTVAEADDQQATCKIAKDPLNPLVVEWPGTAKIDLESTSKRGVVVVSYAGCTLKILSACGAPGSYDYQPTTPARDKLQMSNQNELYARLPLGAASLKGELSSGTSLELDYIAVGQKVVAKPPASLAGECTGATHYVRTITVGAFSLDAHAAGKIGGSVEVGNAGGGIGREENARKLRSQGNVTACAADPNSPECGAILQLGLAPLAVGSSGAVTSAGFGQGVGPLGVVPTVSTMTDLSTGGVGSLKDVDLSYLDMVQTAKRADKDKGMPAETKAQAWDTLSRYPGTNPLRETAEQRRDEWRVVAEAEARRKANLEKLRTQYEADKGKLDKLVSLDDDVVPKAQKDSYRKEFEQVYRPFEADLKEIGAIATVAPYVEGSSSSDSSSSSGLPTPPAESSDSGESTDWSEPPMLGEQTITFKGDFGAHLQGFTMTDDADAQPSSAGTELNYDMGPLYGGGEFDFTFGGERDFGVRLMLMARYHFQAKIPKSGYARSDGAGGSTTVPLATGINTADEATGAFAGGAGLGIAGNIGERAALLLGFNFFVIKFLAPEGAPTQCVSPDDWDVGMLGGHGDIFVGLEYYPLKFLSLGLVAALGYGHVGGDWCEAPGGTAAPPSLVAVGGGSFSATAKSQIGFHF